MIESLKPYMMKFERALVPMARGARSNKVLQITFDISKIFATEVTAFTVREERKELIWTDKVNLVTEAYRLGKVKNVKVIPKIVSAESAKTAIVAEASAHSYDYLVVATTRRSPLSGALFGSIGDYVFKNVRTPVIMASIKSPDYPYRSVIAPISEELSTRSSISFAMHLKKALGCPLVLPDLRKYDRRRTHGFRVLLDNLQSVYDVFGNDVKFVKSGYRIGSVDELGAVGKESGSDVAIVGVRPAASGTLRINSYIRDVVKRYPGDVIVVKKG